MSIEIDEQVSPEVEYCAICHRQGRIGFIMPGELYYRVASAAVESDVCEECVNRLKKECDHE